MYNDAEIYGRARVCDNAEIYDNARVYNNAEIYDNARVYNDAEIYGRARVCGDAKTFGDTEVCGDARVCGRARVYEGKIVGQISQPYKDIFYCQCKNRGLTAILTKDNEILYSVGCQNNITKETFLDRIYNENGGLEKNPHRKEYLKLIPAIEQYFRS